MAGQEELAGSSSGTQDSEDPHLDLALFGSFRTRVVGVRYYHGLANLNEMVRLTRDPHNSYDKWAIRVDNMQNQMIGHIGRDQACHLSPLIDNGQLYIEGYVQGAKGAYAMPIDVVCFGSPDQQSAVTKRLRLGNMQLAAADLEGMVAGAQGQAGEQRMSAVHMGQRLDAMFDELLASQAASQLMDPADEVLSQLFPHQKAALAWMTLRENSCQLPPFWDLQHSKSRDPDSVPVYTNTLTNFMTASRPQPLRGGILADDMGLGKTLVVIALIASNKPGVQMPRIYQEEAQAPAPQEEQGKRKRSEREQEEPDDAPKKKQKGTKKAAAAAAMASSSQPEAVSLTQVAATKAQKAKLAKEERDKQERSMLAAALEPAPQPPAPGGPACTLIVCPLSVLSNWTTQIEEHTAGNLKVYQYHGAQRNRKPDFLAQHDVVLTTYATLGQDLAAGVAKSGLMSVHWLRVVLDEAHNIKNASSQQSRAAAAIKADRRWAVTGTPIQNKLDDLFGFLAFLKLEPLNERQFFTRTLARPIKANDIRGLMKLQVLMQSIAIRRTKTMQVNGKPIVVLPSKTVHLVHVHLAENDRKAYDRLELEGRRIISNHISDNTLMQNYMTVLEIILRLRQVCDSSSLVPEDRLLLKDLASQASGAGKPLDAAVLQRVAALLAEGGDDGCSICLSPFSQPVVTQCGHLYCRVCIESVITKQKALCPLCRAPISASQLLDAPTEPATEILSEEEEQERAAHKAQAAVLAGASSKADALLQRLLANRQTAAAVSPSSSQASGGPIKSVVFSQFLGMLDVVETSLSSAGIRYIRLDGSTPAKARGDMLSTFASRSPSSPEVMLVSLRAGGVGMNLTAACQVHLMDPWWNPSVEEQAMDRVHRLGQTRAVDAFRYIARDTIEERMLQLQERKRALASAAFERSRPDDARNMRIDDVKMLMSL